MTALLLLKGLFIIKQEIFVNELIGPKHVTSTINMSVCLCMYVLYKVFRKNCVFFHYQLQHLSLPYILLSETFKVHSQRTASVQSLLYLLANFANFCSTNSSPVHARVSWQINEHSWEYFFLNML